MPNSPGNQKHILLPTLTTIQHGLNCIENEECSSSTSIFTTSNKSINRLKMTIFSMIFKP
ncbi:hypothetical protein BDE02_19G021900 [Populus trichocarpa]|nr:hypothetical protein BDE02_19G021900 [Populus trichocarpa]